MKDRVKNLQTEITHCEKIKKMLNHYKELFRKNLDDEELSLFDEAIEMVDMAQVYQKYERRLRYIYGDCDGLLDEVIKHLERYEGTTIPQNVAKSRLLTDEDVDKWEAFKALGSVEELYILKEKFKALENLIKEGFRLMDANGEVMEFDQFFELYFNNKEKDYER